MDTAWVSHQLANETLRDKILLFGTLDPSATTTAIDMEKVYDNCALTRSLLSDRLSGSTAQSSSAIFETLI